MGDKLVECAFFVPITRDRNLSDGQLIASETWDWLEGELFSRFEGGTLGSELYKGFYKDPDTRERVDDTSRRYTVALSETKLDELRSLLAAACVQCQQKCIYLSVGGYVEFVKASDHEPTG